MCKLCSECGVSVEITSCKVMRQIEFSLGALSGMARTHNVTAWYYACESFHHLFRVWVTESHAGPQCRQAVPIHHKLHARGAERPRDHRNGQVCIESA